jgi:hypothetical protein
MIRHLQRLMQRGELGKKDAENKKIKYLNIGVG